MLGRLFVLFTIVPVVELYVLIQVGGIIGGWPTVALVMATGAAGAWLARREGLRTLDGIRGALERGELPEDGMMSALLVLVGGILLVTPGVITDVLGLSLLIPPLRRTIARRAQQRLFASANVQIHGFAPPAPGFGPEPANKNIIDVDAVVVETSDASD